MSSSTKSWTTCTSSFIFFSKQIIIVILLLLIALRLQQFYLGVLSDVQGRVGLRYPGSGPALGGSGQADGQARPVQRA